MHQKEIGESLDCESKPATFRLPKKIFEYLQTEANTRQVSLNVLVNQILDRYVEWDSNAQKAGFLPITKGLIFAMMERMSEDEISAMARDVVKKEFKDTLLLFRNEFDMDSIIQIIKTRARISGFQFRSEQEGSRHSIIVKHDMGKKWSTYLANRYHAVFEEFGMPDTSHETSDNTIVFRVDAA